MTLKMKKHKGVGWRVIAMFFLAITVQFCMTSGAHAARKNAPEKATEKITLNFVEVDIATMVNFISKLTGKSFIYDERLSGKVTIVAPSMIGADEVFDLFTSVLEIKGYSTIFTGHAYKIVPSGGIKQGALKVLPDQRDVRANESYVARLIPLTNVQSQDLLPVLQPLVGKDGYISAFGRNNTILIIDTGLNIEKMLGIVRLIDTEPKGFTPEIIYLKYSQAETIGQTLGKIRAGSKNPMARMAAGFAPAADASGPVVDKRLNALILYGSPGENAEYKKLISALDVPPLEATSKMNVYYLDNADASEVARALEGLAKTPPALAAGAGAGPELGGRVSITPDKSTNSLIIMASPEDYQTITQVIKKLDRRPKQVFVEAMITEVSINKTLDVGTKWRMSGTTNGKPIAIGGFGTVDAVAAQNVLTGMAGLTIGGAARFLSVPLTKPDGTTTQLTVPGFAALFSLSELKDLVNVLSTPQILTSDNKEAEIIVGENVPFLSKLERDSTTVNQPILQSIERKDVGITLRIKPQISEGDYIKLDIYQEISAIAPSPTGASDIVTTKRSAKTSVVVKDKQTVVIGGLIQDKETTNDTKVPLLGDIPFIGWLFRSHSTVKEKTNLLVYLTPSIVKEFDELDELTQKKKSEYEKSTAAPMDKDRPGSGTKPGDKTPPEKPSGTEK